MNSLLSFLSQSWPFRLVFEKRSSELVLDETAFEDNKSKEVKVWSWKAFKTVKYLVHYTQGKFVVEKLM